MDSVDLIREDEVPTSKAAATAAMLLHTPSGPDIPMPHPPMRKRKCIKELRGLGVLDSGQDKENTPLCTNISAGPPIGKDSLRPRKDALKFTGKNKGNLLVESSKVEDSFKTNAQKRKFEDSTHVGQTKRDGEDLSKHTLKAPKAKASKDSNVSGTSEANIGGGVAQIPSSMTRRGSKDAQSNAVTSVEVEDVSKESKLKAEKKVPDTAVTSPLVPAPRSKQQDEEKSKKADEERKKKEEEEKDKKEAQQREKRERMEKADREKTEEERRKKEQEEREKKAAEEKRLRELQEKKEQERIEEERRKKEVLEQKRKEELLRKAKEMQRLEAEKAAQAERLKQEEERRQAAQAARLDEKKKKPLQESAASKLLDPSAPLLYNTHAPSTSTATTPANKLMPPPPARSPGPSKPAAQAAPAPVAQTPPNAGPGPSSVAHMSPASSPEEAEEQPKQKKKAPAWADSRSLEQALLQQHSKDPYAIFPLPSTCNLQDIFPNVTVPKSAKRDSLE